MGKVLLKMCTFDFLLLFTIYFASAYTSSLNEYLIHQQWSDFKIAYNRSYNTVLEENERFKVFTKNSQTVEEHNKLYEAGQVTFKISINRYGDMTYTEYVNLNTPNETEYENGNPRYFKIDETMEIPNSVDWREKGAVTRVKDQFFCGSCWAFSAIGSLEGQVFRKNGKLEEFSEQELVDCTNSNLPGCAGGSIYKAYNYFVKNGISTSQSYPYTGKNDKCKRNNSQSNEKILGYARIKDLTVESLKITLAQVGPLEISMNMYSENFMRYSDGIFDKLVCDGEINHAILLVGYGTDEKSGTQFWILKNSFGEKWGMNGFIKVKIDRNPYCLVDAIYPLLSLDGTFEEDYNGLVDKKSVSLWDVLLYGAKIIPIVFCVACLLICCYGAMRARDRDSRDDDSNLSSEFYSNKASSSLPLRV